MLNKIEKKIELKAPVARVWKALSDYKQFGQWFRVNIDGPFVVGEKSTGHMTYPGYEHFPWAVVVTEMQEERLFAFTWHPYAVELDKDYSGETPTLVEFYLEAVPGGTLLTVIESGFDNVPEGRRAEAFRMNEGGWTQQIKNVEEYVSAAQTA